MIATEPVTRIFALALMVPPGTRVADIGTDHGALPCQLLAEGRASHCIATERTATRLLRTTRSIGTTPPPGLELRWGDGLQPLRAADRIDVITISGLGARTMLRILDDPHGERLHISRLVLAPQSEPERVRRWLARQGWGIVDERLVRDRGRWTPIVAAERTAPIGEDPPHPDLLRGDVHAAGPCLLRSADPLVARFWREQLERLEGIVSAAGPGPGSSRAAAERDMARRVLSVLPVI